MTELAILVFSTGQRVPLDRPLLLGRRPGSGAAGTGTVRLRGRRLSRRHASIELDGWHAVLTDLGSTNGTTVAEPDRGPIVAPPGCPVTLVPGATVALAGEVRFVVQPIG